MLSARARRSVAAHKTRLCSRVRILRFFFWRFNVHEAPTLRLLAAFARRIVAALLRARQPSFDYFFDYYRARSPRFACTRDIETCKVANPKLVIIFALLAFADAATLSRSKCLLSSAEIMVQFGLYTRARFQILLIGAPREWRKSSPPPLPSISCRHRRQPCRNERARACVWPDDRRQEGGGGGGCSSDGGGGDVFSHVNASCCGVSHCARACAFVNCNVACFALRARACARLCVWQSFVAAAAQ